MGRHDRTGFRVYDQGAFFRVTVSEGAVYAWKRRWPGSNLPDRTVSFTFDKRNGDLVDMHPLTMDGADALALSQDAQKYGEEMLKLRRAGKKERVVLRVIKGGKLDGYNGDATDPEICRFHKGDRVRLTKKHPLYAVFKKTVLTVDDVAGDSLILRKGGQYVYANADLVVHDC